MLPLLQKDGLTSGYTSLTAGFFLIVAFYSNQSWPRLASSNPTIQSHFENALKAAVVFNERFLLESYVIINLMIMLL